MFESVKELKLFIIWAKEQKIKKITINDISVEFSELAFLEDIESMSESSPETEKYTSQLQNEKDVSKEDDELLMWSSIGK